METLKTSSWRTNTITPASAEVASTAVLVRPRSMWVTSHLEKAKPTSIPGNNTIPRTNSLRANCPMAPSASRDMSVPTTNCPESVPRNRGPAASR